ncbi:MAG: methyltransferase domain-containing protein [Eubacteriales bacterium]|nr:methyltransferase domain-containing protein [Eubacteriales bacterium]
MNKKDYDMGPERAQVTLNDLAREQGEEKFWAEHAALYDKVAALEKHYTTYQVEAMDLRPTDTVLDLGCGVGRLCIPIARRVKEVIAVDISSDMLACAQRNAKAAGLNNITFRQCDFGEAGVLEGLPKTDITVCSRIPFLSFIRPVSERTKRMVYVTGFANAPNLMQVKNDFFWGVPGNPQRQFSLDRMQGYNVFFNAVYEAGYDASVILLPDGFRADYPSVEACLEDLATLGNVPEGAWHTFESNITPFLKKTEKGVRFERKTESFLLYWATQPTLNV